MKNKELIELLKKEDPEKPVCFEDDEWGNLEVRNIVCQKTYQRCNPYELHNIDGECLVLMH